MYLPSSEPWASNFDAVSIAKQRDFTREKEGAAPEGAGAGVEEEEEEEGEKEEERSSPSLSHILYKVHNDLILSSAESEGGGEEGEAAGLGEAAAFLLFFSAPLRTDRRARNTGIELLTFVVSSSSLFSAEVKTLWMRNPVLPLPLRALASKSPESAGEGEPNPNQDD